MVFVAKRHYQQACQFWYPHLRRIAKATEPAQRPRPQSSKVSGQVSLLAAPALAARKNKHHKMRGQCHIPVDKKICGNFRYKCPVDVSSGMVPSSPCRVNWYKLKALIVQLFPDASKSGTPVPAKVTFGHALFRRKWAMEVVTTTFLPCADTSEIGDAS